LNDLLQEFVKKSDIFNQTQDKEKTEQITVDKKQYVALKNSYIQTNALIVYYEKLLYDLLGKLGVDLKNYEIIQKYSNKKYRKVRRIK